MKNCNLESNNRGWFKKPTLRLITSKIDNHPQFEYETKLIDNDITYEIAKYASYIDTLLNHKWYTMKYDLKKKINFKLF